MYLILLYIHILKLVFSSNSETKMTQIEMIKSKGNIFTLAKWNTFDVIETKQESQNDLTFPTKHLVSTDTLLWNISNLRRIRGGPAPSQPEPPRPSRTSSHLPLPALHWLVGKPLHQCKTAQVSQPGLILEAV